MYKTWRCPRARFETVSAGRGPRCLHRLNKYLSGIYFRFSVSLTNIYMERNHVLNKEYEFH